MRTVVALGENALLKRGEPMTAEQQRVNVRHAAMPLAELIAAGHQIIVTHGNGPQVGLLELQAAAGPPNGVHSLDLLGAQTEGMIGIRKSLPTDPWGQRSKRRSCLADQKAAGRPSAAWNMFPRFCPVRQGQPSSLMVHLRAFAQHPRQICC